MGFHVFDVKERQFGRDIGGEAGLDIVHPRADALDQTMPARQAERVGRAIGKIRRRAMQRAECRASGKGLPLGRAARGHAGQKLDQAGGATADSLDMLA